ncbi:sulfatase-like hydrolase/transferase [Marimonas arenosa]|uniref:Sulfatase-like hydrolase/transferase n=1 Tax=Marimonas arenosa TaxID=1795305 RepID=A0AAE3WEL8_9RHOB|nr:sulfatase-like hydrolase/transferase [Marimonas arenosa]MDQ2090280.1 sulfatase-like hydrolase/transferase [Marimonas arenosa]
MTEQANTEIGTANGGGPGRFILWAGAVLGLLLAVVRVAALRGHLDGRGFGEALSLVVQGVMQDWLMVLVLTLVFAALVRSTDAHRLRKIFVAVFTVLATLLLLAGLANLVALRMLGAPLTMEWVVYSDLTHTDVALDYMRRVISGKVIAVALISVVVFLGSARALNRWRYSSGPAVLSLGVMALAVVSALAARNVPTGVATARLENPIVAFIASIGGETGIDGIDGLAETRKGTDMPFTTVEPLARPKSPVKPIRNAILFAYESTPANQAQGWGGIHPVTPNLAAALDKALAFDRAYAHVPASNYYLVSVFAGIIPELSSISMMASRPNLDAIFLPEVMRANGLRTAFFNSSDNRFQDTEGLVRAAGFEQIGDYRDWECETGVYEFSSVTDKYLNTSSDLCTVNEIIEWVEERPEEPFFVAFRTGMTHYPYFPGEDPQRFVEDETQNDYLNALRVGDQAFGKLMAWLDESGLADETLVVVLGDHGEAFGQHGTYVHAAGIYEENVHIPMALINPQIFSGTRSDLIVGIADVAATITDLLGIPTPSSWQGRSVFAKGRRNGVLFFSPWNGFLVGYREGNEKYIYNGNSGEAALFDLAADPGETDNLVEDDPQAAKAARAKLGAAVAAHQNYIAWLLERRNAAPLEQAAGTEIEIVASGTKFKTAPKGWVMIDGEHVGGFEVTAAPSNAERDVTLDEINAALTPFRLPVEVGECPRKIEIFFLNDEWAGDGKTGDTDLYVRSVKFAGTTYYFTRFALIDKGVGGHTEGNFRFWRKGGIRIDLDLDQACLSADLAAK